MISLNIRHWINKKDKQFENILLNCGWEWYAAAKGYEYSRKILCGRWKKGEHLIVQSPYYAYLYAKNVMKNRWKEAEPLIVESNSAYGYARYVMKSPWEDAEKTIAKSFRDSYLYARYVLKDRFIKGERQIERTLLKNGRNYYFNNEYVFKYAKYVIKGRYEKFEHCLSDSIYIKQYMEILDEKGKEEFHNKVLMKSIEDYSKYYSNHAKLYIQSLSAQN
jgi:hypothetical protein